MRKAAMPNRRLAIALYYLATTAEYRTTGYLFGVSVAFVCMYRREESVRGEIRWHQQFHFQVERTS